MTAIGYLITVSATPVKTGNTSLDVYVTATVENPNTGVNRTVCSAFFTYVTCKGPDGQRPKVPSLDSASDNLFLGSSDDDETTASSLPFAQDTGNADDWLSFVARCLFVAARKLGSAICYTILAKRHTRIYVCVMKALCSKLKKI